MAMSAMTFTINADTFTSNDPRPDIVRLAETLNNSIRTTERNMHDIEMRLSGIEQRFGKMEAIERKVLEIDARSYDAIRIASNTMVVAERVAKRSICEFNICFEKKRAECGCDSCGRDDGDYCEEVERTYKCMAANEAL